ncbi:hypothetical protein ACUOFC_59710, partial [Escherichia sp. TWPC-MK]
GRLRKKIQAQYPQEVITTVRGQGTSRCAHKSCPFSS